MINEIEKNNEGAPYSLEKLHEINVSKEHLKEENIEQKIIENDKIIYDDVKELINNSSNTNEPIIQMTNEIEKNNEEAAYSSENSPETNVSKEPLKEENIEPTFIENDKKINDDVKENNPSNTNEPNIIQENAGEKLVFLEVNKLTNLLNNLSNDFNIKLKYDKHKDIIIDKLHAENQILKDNLYKKIMIPIVNNLIILIDDYTKLTIEYNNKISDESDNYKQLLKHFGNIIEDLTYVLSVIGVEELITTHDKLDATKQKVIKIVNTDNPTLDKTICEKIKKGFTFEDKIMRPEIVSCYKYINQLLNLK